MFPGLNSPNALDFLLMSLVTYRKRSWRCWQGRVTHYQSLSARQIPLLGMQGHLAISQEPMSTCIQFHSEITLIQSYPLSPCVTTLWHWMIKYSWKNVQGVCFSSTLLCICQTCDQMFMPGSFKRSVCRGVLGVCLACHAFWGKVKGYNFESDKQSCGLECELHSIP